MSDSDADEEEEGAAAAAASEPPPAAPPPVDEDVFVTVLGEFYNWAAERKESVESDLGAAEAAFSALHVFLGEEALTEREPRSGRSLHISPRSSAVLRRTPLHSLSS